MKGSLVFVIGSLDPGGAERVVSLLASKFVQEGYSVTIISKQKCTPFYELDSKVNVWYPSNQIEYSSKFRRIFTSIKMYLEILNYIKKISPSFILPISTTTSGILVLIGKLLNKKVIVCEHTNYKAGLSSLGNRIIKKHIYKYASTVVVLTERDKNEFYDKLYNHVRVIPNPLSLTPIKVQDSFDREPIILAIGNMDCWHIKGFDTLIDVFRRIYRKYPNWKLLFVGGGDGSYIKEIVEYHEMLEYVKFGGLQKDVKEVMRKSEILVLTSRWEGLPMVVIESMSQGLPCIAFDCYSGPRDIITHDFNGYLVEDQNSEAFEMALERLISNEAERERFAKNALSTSKDYLPNQIIPLWLNLFNSLK
jgi:GalNAc-alpha-(1->4)-GalNAc-alpha-(1->3)-diNAcBac-PP-undecaprenol alpha-1,4-N-acetyl-D-galactosaminyltransferase